MSARAARKGYTLIELIFALSISTIVLVGIYAVVSSFASIEVEGVKKGTAAGWTLVGVDAMTREIEGANVLAVPTTGTPQGDYLVACMNWTRVTGGNLNGVGISGGGGTTQPVMVYYYCYDSTNNVLRRKVTNSGGTCPALSLSPCDAATYAGGVDNNNVVAISVYRITTKYTASLITGNSVFARDDAMNSVRAQFLVGNPTPTPNTPLIGTTPRGNVTNSIALAVDTRISLDRPTNSIGSGD